MQRSAVEPSAQYGGPQSGRRQQAPVPGHGAGSSAQLRPMPRKTPPTQAAALGAAEQPLVLQQAPVLLAHGLGGGRVGSYSRKSGVGQGAARAACGAPARAPSASRPTAARYDGRTGFSADGHAVSPREVARAATTV